MGGSASIESNITIFDADTNNVITKIQNVNLKKLTLADCRDKLMKRLNINQKQKIVIKLSEYIKVFGFKMF